MESLPRLTVVMPVLDGQAVLPSSLEALVHSDLPRAEWELLIVDDGSADGPGFARNLAAEHAEAPVLVFIDADVCVHADTLGHILLRFEDAPELGALFGAYDDRPADPRFLSQYRNLLHRYVHLRGAGDAETFWAGCGAVRSDLFEALGGFDTEAFPRPQIEDIELGYRIRDAGYRILLDPTVAATHLKRWTFLGIVKTDLFDRGLPWMRLLLRSDRQATLNVGHAEKLKTALVGLALLIVAIGVVRASLLLTLTGLIPAAVVVAWNLHLLRWFARKRGWFFAARAIPMNLLYYVISGLAVVLACVEFGLYLGRRERGTSSTRIQGNH
jgi:glycosyltransferase involved in cell wall biosynthesis